MDSRLRRIARKRREEEARLEFGLDDMGTDAPALVTPRPLRAWRPTPKGGKAVSHLWIPDTQVSPEAPWDHLGWAGRYAADRKPNVIILAGDHWDMPSLSSYDAGKRGAENRRYMADVRAGNAALALLTREIRKGSRTWKPRLILLRGNHENRIERAIEADPKYEGTIGYHHFNDRALGWEVIDYLKPIEVDGVRFCHFFPRGPGGSVTQAKRGAPSARLQVQREMISCVAGHKQGLDTYVHNTGERTIRGIIAGSFYQHSEPYLTPQGNAHWMGVLVLHEVHDGNFDLMEVSLDYLRRKYS